MREEADVGGALCKVRAVCGRLHHHRHYARARQNRGTRNPTNAARHANAMGRRQGVARHFYVNAPPPTFHRRACVDASPWGIGGTLVENGTPMRWFADKLTSHDQQRFRATLGDLAFNTVWEALAY